MTRVYVDDLGYRSPSVRRVIEALTYHAPDYVTIADRQEEADLVVMHVYGRINNIRHRIQSLDERQRYAIIQYTLRASRNPNTVDWMPMWIDAAAVWSYLDIQKMAWSDFTRGKFNFYHAPLGVEKVFRPLEKTHTYQICTSGALYMTEGVRECHLAAHNLGRRTAHLGPKVRDIPDLHCYSGLDDEALVRLYNQCDYVAGLRRKEGFELCAAEALCCGVRPILYDAQHYRKWYDGLGLFIPEVGRDDVQASLAEVFSRELQPVTEAEVMEAKRRFDWERLVTGFYEYTGLHH